MLIIIFFKGIIKSFFASSFLYLKGTGRKLYSLNSFLNHPLKFLFSPLGQLDFYIIQKSDWCFVVVLVMNNVIEVDKERLMRTIKIIVRQVTLDFLEDTC